MLKLSLKKEALNPAVLADDALDAYLQYNRANKNMQAKKQPKPISNTLPDSSKEASYADKLEPYMAKLIANPSILIPSAKRIALSAAGVATSMYGPDWAGGPSEHDLAEGKRFSAARAFKSIVSSNVLGETAYSMPAAARSLLNTQSNVERLCDIGTMLPGVVAAGTLSRNLYTKGEPDMHNVVANTAKAHTLNFALQAPYLISNSPSFMATLHKTMADIDAQYATL